MAALAKVFVLSRNEHDLIDDFLTYYSALFGAENVVLIDNGSDDPRVLAAYAMHRARGVTVELESTRDMRSMGAILSDAMNRHKHTCRFMLPLDTDEFIFFPDAGGVGDALAVTAMEARERVAAVLRGAPADVSVLRYARFLGSVPDPSDSGYVGHRHQRPAHSITTFYDQGWDKLIVRADAFLAISTGNHHAAVTHGRTETTPLLGLLHFHETGGRRKHERCVMSLVGYRHMDPSGMDAHTQLRGCDYLVALQTQGGHRVVQYRELLRRGILCDALEGRLEAGRLPCARHVARLANEDALWERVAGARAAAASAASADQEAEAVREVVLAAAEAGRGTPLAPAGACRDDVVFYDADLSEAPHALLMVTQVRGLLSALSSSQGSSSPVAP